MSVVLDAHVHLWDVDRHRLAWFRDGLGLPARVVPADLRAAAEGRGAAGAHDGAGAPGLRVDGALAVQAGDGADEVRWLTAHRDPVLRGAVLQYVPGAGPGTGYAAARPEPGGLPVRGVRVAVPGRDAGLGDVPGLDALLEHAARTRLVVEFLVRPAQLPAVAGLAARHPGATVVLCHLGLGAGEPDTAWADGLALAADQPGVAAKVSGLVTAAPGDDERMARVLGVALAAFGADRLLFGSDWPMSARVAPYPEVVARTAAALPPPPAAGWAGFWGATAARLYGL